MWNSLFTSKGSIWTIGHWVYEQKTLRNLIAPVVNILKPDFVMSRGHKVYIDKNDRVISMQLILDGKWEDEEIELFEKSIRPGDVVVDIGANIGLYTLAAARKAGITGKVYAFEPDPHNFKLLLKNIAANGYTNIKAVNKAVGEIKSTGKLFLSKENNFGDLTTYDPKDGRKSIGIETTTVDLVVKGHKVNVIKIDIQGSEVKAIKGAVKTIKSQNQLVLFSEFWPRGLKACGSSAEEYLKLLKSLGFKVYEILKNNKLKIVNDKQFLKAYPERSMVNADIFCKK